MKFTIFVALFAVIFAMAIAYPHEIDTALEGAEETHQVSELQHGLRQKRATCDLLASEQLCAVHCLVKGFKGGWCDSRKVCNCRK